MRSLGFAEVAIVVNDVAASKTFYVDLLGYTEAHFDTYTPPVGSTIIQVGPDHFLGLWEPGIWSSDYLDGSYGDYFGNNIGQSHLVMAIAQDEVQPLADRLTGAGLPIAGPMPHGDGSLHLYISDPDGHAIEFWGK